jgi:ArsR family transcriptional regulator, arsenate/arsenite/antimonite-responsive transcriptional repressor
MRDTIKAYKALSDETRLRVLLVLMEQECCVCEIMQALDISQTRASRSLAALYDAGFLKLRREGQWSFYSLDRKNMPDYMQDLTGAAGKALQDSEIVELDRKRLKKAVRTVLCGTQ